MNKYFLVAKHTWDEMLTYRLNFSVWRIRQVFQFLAAYFLWTTIIPAGSGLTGYSHESILTYVFLTTFVGSFVFSSRSAGMGDEITNGNLSNFLLKPINYFRYWAARDFGDKAMNISWSIGELFILFIFLRPPFFWQRNVVAILLFVVTLGIAMMLYFFSQLLISTLAFWIYETWSLRFLFMILLNFLAGSVFPLNLFPKPIYAFLQFLPFPYLLYFPVKIYLGQESLTQSMLGIGIGCIWVFLLYLIVFGVWHKGIKAYTAVGR